jgi:hypothetical protein
MERQHRGRLAVAGLVRQGFYDTFKKLITKPRTGKPPPAA